MQLTFKATGIDISNEMINISNKEKEDTDGLISRFSSLSTNGKVIIIALTVLIVGILLLLVLLIVYFVKKSLNRPEDFVLEVDDDFDDNLYIAGN